MMKNGYRKSQWEIGWESLPKYIGHKIYNKETKEIVTVIWDNGFPEYIKSDSTREHF